MIHFGTIEVKNMSHGNEQARHKPTCKPLETVAEECAIIMAAGSSSKVPSEKRKEAADPILYLDRV